MNYKEYLKYYDDVKDIDTLISKKLPIASVKVSESDYTVLYDDLDKKIVQLWECKYILIEWGKIFYTIEKKLYNKYSDFKIKSASVFTL